MGTAIVRPILINVTLVDTKEIVNGIRNRLQVGMSNGQAHLLAEYLDANGDG